jgi:quercetin dioxygenase-like cupin family protein
MVETWSAKELRNRPVERYGSQGAGYTPLLRVHGDVSATWIKLEPGGILGPRQAPVDQLFIVIEGQGTASVGEGDPMHRVSGTIVLWRQGEIHQTASEAEGIAALVLEGPDLAQTLMIGPGVKPLTEGVE